MFFLKKSYKCWCAFFYSFMFIHNYGSFDRLGTYGLAEFQIEGDGNCQVYFSSTSVHFIIPYIKYIMLHHQHGSLLAACNLALS
jgi:hypothetical protein